VRKLKFLHAMGGSEIGQNIKKTLEEQPARSGMYNWLFVFGGDIKPFSELDKGVLENYDAVQINMSPVDMAMIPEIRKMLDGSSTKLVLNNDYVSEYWGKWGIDPFRYDQLQRMADMLFTTEKHQASNMLDGTFVMPHPSNTEYLKHLGSDYQSESIGFLFHWWAGHTYLPSRTLRLAKKLFGLKSKMYGYWEKWDEMKQYKGAMFDTTLPLMRFPEFAQAIQGERLVYDPNPFHTYGRNGVELACWKRPVVGSNRVFSYNKLFPEFTVDPFDTKQTLEVMKKVLAGGERVDKIMDRAHKEVEYFNYDNSRKRFFDALDKSTERGGHEWYHKNG